MIEERAGEEVFPESAPQVFPLVDAHCHLDAFARSGEEALSGVLSRARAAGVLHLVVNGLWQGKRGDFGPALSLARRFPDFISATVAVQPHDLLDAAEDDFLMAEAIARDPMICAIGETGLEYHYDVGPRELQTAAMARHIRLAMEVKKPLILHIRDGHADALRIFRETGAASACHPTQIHCFSGTLSEAKAWIDLGCYLSFSGMLTFRGKSSEPIRQAAALAPADRILVETDSPYLAPVPHRGKTCEPAYVAETLKCLAALRGLEAAEAARLTSENAARLFGFSLSDITPGPKGASL